jgi:hypothetical protein
MKSEKKKQTFMDAFVISKKQQRETSVIWPKGNEEEKQQEESSPNDNTPNLKKTTNNENIISVVDKNESVEEMELEAAEEYAVSEAQHTVFPDLDQKKNGNHNDDNIENMEKDTDRDHVISTDPLNTSTTTNPFDEEPDEEKALVVYQTSSLEHDNDGENEKDEIVVWNKSPSDSIHDATSPKHHGRTAMIPFQKKYSDIPSNTNSEHQNKKTKFQLGDYEISIPRTKAPWVGMIASGLILIASLLFKDEIIHTKLAIYGYVLASVGILGGILQLIVSSSENVVGKYIKYFLFLWCFVGACVMTFKPGHFVETGNGYFASWGMVVFVAMGADPPGDESSLTRNLLDNVNSTMKLGAVSVLFIASLAVEFDHGLDQYKGEAVYAICVAVISIFLVILFSIWKYIQSNVTVSVWEAFLWGLIAIAWIIAAVIVTFRGPFDTMGNGYFSSWIGASIAFHTCASAWKARSRDVMTV